MKVRPSMNIRPISIKLIFCFFLLLSFPALAAEYFSVAEDIPIMDGMLENIHDSVVFDTSDGRVVKIYAQSRYQQNAIDAFYKRSLPALGWHWIQDAPLTFYRGDESLMIRPGGRKEGWQFTYFKVNPRPQ